MRLRLVWSVVGAVMEGAEFAGLPKLKKCGVWPSKKILFELSGGKISLMEATRLLGFQDAGYTLHLMAEEGLPMKCLSEETVKRQAAESLEAMKECLLLSKDKTKRLAKKTIHQRS